MRITRPGGSPKDALTVPRAMHGMHPARHARLTTGLPLSDRRLLLYAIGPTSSVRDCFAHAAAMARIIDPDITIALVCQRDYPHAMDEFGMDRWNQIVYLVDRRPVLSWPIGVDRLGADAPAGDA